MEQQPTQDFSGKKSRVEDKDQAQIEAELAHKKISKQLEQLSKLARIAKESGFEDEAQEADEAMASLIEGVKIEQSKFNEEIEKLLGICIKLASGQSIVDKDLTGFGINISGNDAIEFFNLIVSKQVGEGQEEKFEKGHYILLGKQQDAEGKKFSVYLELWRDDYLRDGYAHDKDMSSIKLVWR